MNPLLTRDSPGLIIVSSVIYGEVPTSTDENMRAPSYESSKLRYRLEFLRSCWER